LLTGIDFTKIYWKSLNGYGATPPLDTKNPTRGRPTDPIGFQTKSVQDQFITGLYLQDQIRYDALTFTLGGRYDWVSTDTDNTDLASGALSTINQSDRAFTWRAGVTYETEWGITPYASYSTAFSPNAGVNLATGNPFKPTESEQQEVGVKYLLPDSNTLLTAALFNIDQTNGLYYEVVDLPSGPANIQVQRGKLRSRGLELEASTSLDNGLSLIASYTYTQAKIIDGPAGTVNNDVSSVPRHMASLWAHYTMPEDGALAGLGFGAGVRFTGESYGNDANSLKNKARAFVDASIDYDFAAIDKDFAGLKLQVNATNLFDRQDAVCSAGFCYRDQGRTIIGSLKYSW
ncbi:MAG: TonB-dependent receptor, partial [Proteobacteria bacterium]|nr:TonB-dependent receptor [Pseudomonadota bacterium]